MRAISGVFGRDLRTWDRSYYRRIGVAFESPNHYLKLSAVENLRLFAGLHGGHTEPAESLLRRVGLHEDGNKRVAEFSKGMRGRLTLARALLHRPELLFLDEPTAGLDPLTARMVRHVIREVREAGATIFLTTHDMITAMNSATEWHLSSTARSRPSTVRGRSDSRAAVVLFDSRSLNRDARGTRVSARRFDRRS